MVARQLEHRAAPVSGNPSRGPATLRSKTRTTRLKLRSRPGRLFSGLLTVILGFGFLAGTLVLREQMCQAFHSGIGTSVVYDLYALAPQGQSGIETEIGSLSSVTDVQPQLRGVGTLAGAHSAQYDQTPVALSATLRGAYGPHWTAGRAPGDSSQIAFEEGGAKKLDLSVGSSVDLTIQGVPQTFEVVGIYTFESPIVGAIHASLSPQTASDLLGATSTPQVVAMNVAQDGNLAESTLRDTQEAVQRTLGDQASVLTTDEYSQVLRSESLSALGFIEPLLIGLAGVALIALLVTLAGVGFALSAFFPLERHAKEPVRGVRYKSTYAARNFQAFGIGLVLRNLRRTPRRTFPILFSIATASCAVTLSVILSGSVLDSTAALPALQGDFVFSGAQVGMHVARALLQFAGLLLLVASIAFVVAVYRATLRRTGELVVLHAFGMQRAGLAALVGAEVALLSVVGAGLGVALGVGLSVLAQNALADLGLAALSLPWQLLLGVFVATPALGLVSTGFAVSKATRTPLRKALVALDGGQRAA